MTRPKHAAKIAALYVIYAAMLALFAIGGYKIHQGLGFILPACVLFIDYQQAMRRRVKP
jgi:hypothetical protein